MFFQLKRMSRVLCVESSPKIMAPIPTISATSSLFLRSGFFWHSSKASCLASFNRSSRKTTRPCLVDIFSDSKKTVPEYFHNNPNKLFDYILVDGGHDKKTAGTDLENISDHVAKGGIVIFDDIGPESYKLIDVWEAFKKKHENEFTFYEKYHRKGVAWAFRR